ncbi:hypothetical protein BFF78_06265 [Streptomyces fodineus]|uniref:Uncharacterized protein n=1 Tax=Streptomyces fodineus TaxID=1904616 RepID=A0A1D7Y554_9ACTN|nr:hypothetical protein BFF78_06265 [Streptomyces fodineus]
MTAAGLHANMPDAAVASVRAPSPEVAVAPGRELAGRQGWRQVAAVREIGGALGITVLMPPGSTVAGCALPATVTARSGDVHPHFELT